MINNLKRLSKSKFVRNVTIVASGTAGAQAITIAFTPIITRLYGPEAFGMLGAFMAILAIATPIAALTYPIAIVLPKSDADASRIARLSAGLGVVMASFIVVVLLIYGSSLADLLSLQPIASYLLLIPLAMLFSAFRQILQQWLIRKKQFQITARAAVVQALVLSLTITGVGCFYPVGAALIVLAVLGHMLHALLLWLGLRKQAKHNLNSPQLLDKNGNKLKFSTLIDVIKKYRDFPLYRAPQVTINALSQSLPVLMLAIFFGPVAAGFFTLTKSVLAAPSALIGASVADVFYPRAVEAVRKNENIKSMLLKSTGGLFLIALPLFSTVIIFGPWLFDLVFGSAWHEAGAFARWVALWLLFSLAARPTIALIPVLRLQGYFLLHEITFIIIKVISLYMGYLANNEIFAVMAYSLVSAFSYVCIFSIVFLRICKGSN